MTALSSLFDLSLEPKGLYNKFQSTLTRANCHCESCLTAALRTCTSCIQHGQLRSLKSLHRAARSTKSSRHGECVCDSTSSPLILTARHAVSWNVWYMIRLRHGLLLSDFHFPFFVVMHPELDPYSNPTICTHFSLVHSGLCHTCKTLRLIVGALHTAVSGPWSVLGCPWIFTGPWPNDVLNHRQLWQK